MCRSIADIFPAYRCFSHRESSAYRGQFIVPSRVFPVWGSGFVEGIISVHRGLGHSHLRDRERSVHSCSIREALFRSIADIVSFAGILSMIVYIILSPYRGSLIAGTPFFDGVILAYRAFSFVWI